MNTRRFTSIVCALLLASSAFVYAQSATSSITGTVIDTAGGAIPGAAVVVKNDAGAAGMGAMLVAISLVAEALTSIGFEIVEGAGEREISG